MKRILAMIPALIGAAGACAQDSVSIYGLLDIGLAYTDRVASSPAPALTAAGQTSSRVVLNPSQVLGSRIGFRGTEDLGGGLKAIFVLEGGLQPDTGTFAQGGVPFGRRAVVGLSGGFGVVTIGRQREALGDIFGLYTAANDFGILVTNIHAGGLDPTQGGARLTNSVRYDTAKVGGFFASGVVALGEEAGNSTAGRSTSLALMYDQGAWHAGIGHFRSSLGATSSNTNQALQGALTGAAGDRAFDATVAGVRYKSGPATVYAGYSRVRQPLAVASTTASFAAAPTYTSAGRAFTVSGPNNSRVDVLDIGFRWVVGATPLHVIGSFQHERAKFVRASDGKANQLNIGVDYFLSKRTDLYALFGTQRTSNMYSSGITGGAPGRDRSQNALVVGVKHTF